MLLFTYPRILIAIFHRLLRIFSQTLIFCNFIMRCLVWFLFHLTCWDFSGYFQSKKSGPSVVENLIVYLWYFSPFCFHQSFSLPSFPTPWEYYSFSSSWPFGSPDLPLFLFISVSSKLLTLVNHLSFHIHLQ